MVSGFNFEFYFLLRYCGKDAFVLLVGQPSEVRLATLWQIWRRVSEGIASNLANLLKGAREDSLPSG